MAIYIYIYIAIYVWVDGGRKRKAERGQNQNVIRNIREAAGVHRRARIARVQSVSRNTGVEIDWIQIFGRVRSNEI